MEYKGKLYGKLFNKYFDTGKTADDWDNLEKENEDLKLKIKELVDRINELINHQQN